MIKLAPSILSADFARLLEDVKKVEEAGFEVRNVEGKDGANWILLDLGDVVVHVFKTETRQFYNLEKLWSDAPLADIDDWIKE